MKTAPMPHYLTKLVKEIVGLDYLFSNDENLLIGKYSVYYKPALTKFCLRFQFFLYHQIESPQYVPTIDLVQRIF